MQTLKPVFGVIGALVPVIYCSYLLYYFLDLSGSVQEAQDIGLGPTMLGLSIVGLLFCIPLILKIAKLFKGPHSPGSDGRGGPDAPDEGGFDVDAAIARYKAQQSAEAARPSPAASPKHENRGSAERQSFGRRTR